MEFNEWKQAYNLGERFWLYRGVRMCNGNAAALSGAGSISEPVCFGTPRFVFQDYSGEYRQGGGQRVAIAQRSVLNDFAFPFFDGRDASHGSNFVSGQDTLDPRKLTFSQTHGYEELPQPLKLEELSEQARLELWSLLYTNVKETWRSEISLAGGDLFCWFPWDRILQSLHEDVLCQPMDEFASSFSEFVRSYKHIFRSYPFNQIFDLLQAIMRHEDCPPEYIQSVAEIFKWYRLAYIVDVSPPVTIYPAASEEEGKAILRATAELRNAGLAGAVIHLRQASDCISQGDNPGAIRESIHVVESAARHLDSDAKTLEPALKALEREQTLHPALKQAFSNLYGYTCDEQGIRHALIDNPQANVGQDEAVFMLGACASFSSYLARKHRHRAS